MDYQHSGGDLEVVEEVNMCIQDITNKTLHKDTLSTLNYTIALQLQDEEGSYLQPNHHQQN